MGAAALGRAIGEGADPVEVAEAFLAAIADHPDGARVYARTTPERARAEAAAARDRARAGTRRGPLDGVPVSWKDLFDTAGVRTEGGTALLAGRVPQRDAAVVARGARAGLVALGKTHLTELAFSGLGLNPVTATPPNRFDPAWLPGGSSSGAAASVALGLAGAAVGSDTGGSARLPAAWNGIVGFKPAHGALPLEGALALCPSFDTVGPMGRGVEDVGLLWEALGGPRADLRGASLAGARLGVLRLEGDEAPMAAFERALDALGRAGARVEEVALPVAEAAEAGAPLFPAEAWASWRDAVGERADLIFAPVRARLLAGRDVGAADYLAARARLGAARGAARAALAAFDAVLWPACPMLPPPVAEVADDPEAFRRLNLRALSLTRVANLLGLASLCLPLPVPGTGLLLNAGPGREGLLLRLGLAAERAMA